MPLYDFVCDNGHKSEELVTSDIKEFTCWQCDLKTKRQPSVFRIDYLRMGLDPYGNPTAGEKWAKMQEQKNRTPTSQG